METAPNKAGSDRVAKSDTNPDSGLNNCIQRWAKTKYSGGWVSCVTKLWITFSILADGFICSGCNKVSREIARFSGTISKSNLVTL